MPERSVPRESLEERFWEKVNKPLGNAGCWEWTACLVTGYGMFCLGGGKRLRAHRYAYELLVGPIPNGLHLDHLCRNPACVNPAHLEPVTCRENVLRGVGPSAQNARKTFCHRGHELTNDNIYRPPKRPNERHCRLCMRIRKREYRARLRSQRLDRS